MGFQAISMVSRTGAFIHTCRTEIPGNPEPKLTVSSAIARPAGNPIVNPLAGIGERFGSSFSCARAWTRFDLPSEAAPFAFAPALIDAASEFLWSRAPFERHFGVEGPFELHYRPAIEHSHDRSVEEIRAAVERSPLPTVSAIGLGGQSAQFAPRVRHHPIFVNIHGMAPHEAATATVDHLIQLALLGIKWSVHVILTATEPFMGTPQATDFGAAVNEFLQALREDPRLNPRIDRRALCVNMGMVLTMTGLLSASFSATLFIGWSSIVSGVAMWIYGERANSYDRYAELPPAVVIAWSPRAYAF